MASEVLQGSRNHFGPRDSEKQAPSHVPTSHYKEMRVPLKWDDLPSGATANDSTVQEIPANAWIESAILRVTTPFTSAGATTLDIGLIESDGTVIDLNGIDEVIAKTAIDAVGETVICDGALVANTAGIGAAAGQVYTTVTTGPYTAGEAVLIIRYFELPDNI